VLELGVVEVVDCIVRVCFLGAVLAFGSVGSGYQGARASHAPGCCYVVLFGCSYW
jgi:hypothetical protein